MASNRPGRLRRFRPRLNSWFHRMFRISVGLISRAKSTTKKEDTDGEESGNGPSRNHITVGRSIYRLSAPAQLEHYVRRSLEDQADTTKRLRRPRSFEDVRQKPDVTGKMTRINHLRDWSSTEESSAQESNPEAGAAQAVATSGSPQIPITRSNVLPRRWSFEREFERLSLPSSVSSSVPGSSQHNSPADHMSHPKPIRPRSITASELLHQLEPPRSSEPSNRTTTLTPDPGSPWKLQPALEHRDSFAPQCPDPRAEFNPPTVSPSQGVADLAPGRAQRLDALQKTTGRDHGVEFNSETPLPPDIPPIEQGRLPHSPELIGPSPGDTPPPKNDHLHPQPSYVRSVDPAHLRSLAEPDIGVAPDEGAPVDNISPRSTTGTSSLSPLEG